MPAISLTELREEDLPFLLRLWQIPEVMRYADEFPGRRGWTKDDDPEIAWRLYKEQRTRRGPVYTQLIVSFLDDSHGGERAPSTTIGEAFIAPLSKGYTLVRVLWAL